MMKRLKKWAWLPAFLVGVVVVCTVIAKLFIYNGAPIEGMMSVSKLVALGDDAVGREVTVSGTFGQLNEQGASHEVLIRDGDAIVYCEVPASTKSQPQGTAVVAHGKVGLTSRVNITNNKVQDEIILHDCTLK